MIKFRFGGWTMRKVVFGGFVAMIIVIASATMINAQVLINYQGRLTGLDGEPVANDNYTITFSLWDDSTGGSQLWTETHASVYTNSGMFTVVLGSDSTLNEAVFENDPIFLRIMIAPDNYISPRTRLTSVPSAAYAKKIVGDIETSQEGLVMKGSTGDSSVVIESGAGRGFPRLFMVEPSDDGKRIEMYANSDGAAFDIYSINQPNQILHIGGNQNANTAAIDLMDPGDNRELLSISSAPEGGGSMVMFNPQPEPPATLLKMNLENIIGTSMYEPRFALYNPDNEYTGQELVRLSSSHLGGKIAFFPTGDIVQNPAIRMGIEGTEPSPFNPATLAFFNPAGVMPNDPCIRMGVEPSPFRGYLELSDPGSGFTDGPLMTMGFEPTPFHKTELYMTNPEISTTPRLLELNVNDSTGEWSSRIAMYDYSAHPPEPGRVFEISNSPTGGASMVMFNPQPEPPAEVFRVSYNMSGKDDGVSLELTESGGTTQTKLTPGRVKVGDDVDDDMPRGEFFVGSDSAIFYIQGASTLAPAPAIAMLSSSTEVKLGIGTIDPSAELHVVGDICYTGTIGTCSDLRYKTDIQKIEHALDKVAELRGVTFNWKRNQYPDHKFSEREQVGLIAQEVEEVLPQVVSEDNDGYYNIDYSKIAPLLIEAIKELKAENDELKKRIQKIESRL
jgi:hypothetical protein